MVGERMDLTRDREIFDLNIVIFFYVRLVYGQYN